MNKLYEKIKDQFPMLKTQMNGKDLVYLDTAATALKPQTVIDKVTEYYTYKTCNVHRSIHQLAENVTSQYEETRDCVKKFINAKKREEIIFTKGTTESLNLLARTLGDQLLKAGDEILLSELEHHSNIVPWQLCAERTGATIKVIPLNDQGDLDLEIYSNLLSPKTKIVSVNGISNTLGTINPLEEMIPEAHKVGAYFIVDAAQMAPHGSIDVQKLDCDFLAFSAHKTFGPTGVGVLYGKENLLNELPPFQGGGDMIDSVSFEKTTYNKLPYKFEAGTPHIAGVLAFNEALKFIENTGSQNIQNYENELLIYAIEKLSKIDGLKIYGNPIKRASVLSFNIENVHTHDLASLLSMEGIAIRTGHHCTQPLMKRLGVFSTARISLSCYNNFKDIDRLCDGINKVKEILL